MNRKEFQTFADNWRERFLTTAEAAKFCDQSPRTWANNRSQGIGCPYYKVHGRVYYDINDLIEYLKSNFLRIETTPKYDEKVKSQKPDSFVRIETTPKKTPLNCVVPKEK